MPLRANMELNDFLEIFRQRKWQIIFSVLIVLFAGIVYCVVIPNQYRSSTTILIVPQRVPEKFVSSTVTYGVEERLAATSRQILSRTRLLEVVDELGLFPEERETVPPEIMAEKMRDRIGIDIIRGQDAFVLSFEHEDPQIAMSTASRLASFFIEENLRTREQLAAGTSEFLDTQLEQVKKRLEEQEEKVKRYKLQHMGELPEEMQANLSMLTRLQDQRRTTAEAIAKAQDRKLFMETQISNMQNQIRTIEGGGKIHRTFSSMNCWQSANSWKTFPRNIPRIIRRSSSFAGRSSSWRGGLQAGKPAEPGWTIHKRADRLCERERPHGKGKRYGV